MKRGYTLSSCCCVYLISFLFPTLPCQICDALRSPFLSPVMFTVSFFPHMSILLLSLFLYGWFTFRRDRVSCHHPVQSSWCVGVCLMRVPFLLLLWLFLPCPLSHISLAGFLYTFFTCFHLPPECLTCCVPGSLWTLFFHLSIHYLLIFHLLW